VLANPTLPAPGAPFSQMISLGVRIRLAFLSSNLLQQESKMIWLSILTCGRQGWARAGRLLTGRCRAAGWQPGRAVSRGGISGMTARGLARLIAPAPPPTSFCGRLWKLLGELEAACAVIDTADVANPWTRSGRASRTCGSRGAAC
jgi:hypothetical protein